MSKLTIVDFNLGLHEFSVVCQVANPDSINNASGENIQIRSEIVCYMSHFGPTRTVNPFFGFTDCWLARIEEIVIPS